MHNKKEIVQSFFNKNTKIKTTKIDNSRIIRIIDKSATKERCDIQERYQAAKLSSGVESPAASLRV